MGEGELFAGDRWSVVWKLCAPLSGRSNQNGAVGSESEGFAQNSDRE